MRISFGQQLNKKLLQTEESSNGIFRVASLANDNKIIPLHIVKIEAHKIWITLLQNNYLCMCIYIWNIYKK